MKQLFLISCLLLLTTMQFVGQTRNVDSLVNVLETQKLSNREQLELYDKLCKGYKLNDLEKLFFYANKGLSLSKKEKIYDHEINFNKYLGEFYMFQGNSDSALVYYNMGLDLSIKTGDEEMESIIYGSIGNVYNMQDMVLTAVDYYLKALALFEKQGNKKGCTLTYVNVSDIYRRMSNYERSKYYVEKAKVIAEELNDAYGKMNVYLCLGRLFDVEGNIDSTLVYALKTLEVSRSIKDNRTTALALQDIADIYCDKNIDINKAEKYALESLSIAEEYEDPSLLSDAKKTLARVYLRKKQYKESEILSMQAWELDTTSQHSMETIATIIEANIYMGKKDRAVEFLKKMRSVAKDIINEKGYRESLADMETKYETQKKEIRIATLEKEKKLYIILGIAVVAALLLGLGLLFYRHRLSVQKQKQLEKEKELIAARSALDAEKAEREIIARDLHDGVGAMLSVVKNKMNIVKSYSIIENSEVNHFNEALDGLDKSIAELRRVAHHIMPAVLIEKGLVVALDDFCRSVPEAKFHVTEPCHRFEPPRELVIYRCAYELVNNALKHAKASRIEVHLSMDEKTVYLSVVDNGCGFDEQTVQTGMGINNLRKRLAAFGGRMDIFSEPAKGTEVNVELEIA